MKKSIPLILALILTLAVAGRARAEEFTPNIHAGNYLTGANGALDRNFTASTTTLTLDLPLQYFVIDRLAVGGAFAFAYADTGGGFSTTAYGLGPAATYYFWTEGHLAAYGAESILYSHTSYSQAYANLYSGLDAYGGDATPPSPSSSAWLSTTQLGIQYFVTPSTAFGPGLSFTRTFANGSPTSDLRVYFGFSTVL
jgi:hypothetical protein